MDWLKDVLGRLRLGPFRGVRNVGTGLRCYGRPIVGAYGSIEVGANFSFGSRPAISHLVALRGARIMIGDDVAIAYGAAITAMQSIAIGDRTQIGPFVVIMDSDFHRVGNRDDSGDVTPVVIGKNVRIGARVTILRGTRIGDNATVLSGSTVQGAVRAGATVSGVPAKPLRTDSAEAGASLR
jgi:acetyltransferase-like isoleucine patch superfamily enzyme